MNEADDALVDHLRPRVHRLWLPTRPLDLDILTAANELRVWLDDDHWRGTGSHAGWLALISDVRAALADTGAPLRATLGNSLIALDAHLETFGEAVRKDKRQKTRAPFASGAISMLAAAEERLRTALAQPESLKAAWDGLVAAARAGENEHTLDQRQVDLCQIAEQAGHPWDRLAQMLSGLLGDSARMVDEARRDITRRLVCVLPRDPERGPAGLSSTERLALIGRYLTLPVAEAVSEVWVAVEDAFLGEATVEVGSITFWDGPTLRAVIDELPSSAPHLPAVVTKHERLFRWLWERRQEGAGFALAQVPVGSGRPSEARADARDTVAAVLALAEFDNGYSSWRVADRGLLHFASGEWVHRDQLDPGRRPQGLELARIAQDSTPIALRNRAPASAPALPLRSARHDVRVVFELIHWLALGRTTPGPSRIVLTKRVIERAAGWAGVREDVFTDQQLAIPWARGRTINHIGRATRAALEALRRGGDGQLQAWQSAHDAPFHIVSVEDGAVETTRALEHLDWLKAQLHPNTKVRSELESLSPITHDVSRYADWVDDLVTEFGQLRRRYSRHRNAIVHGGPIDEQSISTIQLFADALAVDILGAAIEGVLIDEPLAAHFARRKLTYERWLADLREPGPPLHQRLAVPI
jgi:hypothetical protein